MSGEALVAFALDSFLIQFLAIVGGAAIFRRLAFRVGQPRVVGELFYGVLLGPSFLGWIWPQGFSVFFPAENRPLLEALGWIGLILFLYTVGAELHWTPTEAWPIFFVAAGGLIIPFVLGSVLGLAAPAWFFPGEPQLNGMILMGVIMSVSALAVLGRLLVDLDLLGTRTASLALGAATIDDIAAWVLLAIVAGTGQIGLVGNLNLNLLVVALLFGAVLLLDRFLSPYFVKHAGRSSPLLFPILLVAIFASALLTHEAGLHAVLGPFAVGALMSRHPVLKEYSQTRMGEIIAVLFLPAFFVLAGMNVDLTALEYPEGLWALGIVILVATVAKLAGAYAGGRASGIDARESLRVGLLLNTRGAVGLVVAEVGLQAGLLSTAGFSLLVIMIAVTTLFAPIALGFMKRGTIVPERLSPQHHEA